MGPLSTQLPELFGIPQNRGVGQTLIHLAEAALRFVESLEESRVHSVSGVSHARRS